MDADVLNAGKRPFSLYSAGAPSLLLLPENGITHPSDLVSNWDDQSGNGNHAAQGTAGSRPAYSTTAGPTGGIAVVNSSTKNLVIPDAVSLNPTGSFVLFVLARRTGATAFQCLVNPASDTAWNLTRFGLGCSTDGTTMVAWAGNYASGRVTWASDTAWHVHELYFSGGTLQYLVDGVSKGTVAATPVAQGALCIGGGLVTAPSTYGYPWQGPIAGVELIQNPTAAGRPLVRRAWGARGGLVVA